MYILEVVKLFESLLRLTMTIKSMVFRVIIILIIIANEPAERRREAGEAAAL